MTSDEPIKQILETLSALLAASEQRTLDQLETIHTAVLDQRHEMQELVASLIGATGTRVARSSVPRRSSAEQLDNAVVAARSSVPESTTAEKWDEAVRKNHTGIRRAQSVSMCGATTETQRKEQLRLARDVETDSDRVIWDEVIPSDEFAAEVPNPKPAKGKWQVVLSGGGVPSVVPVDDKTKGGTCHPTLGSLVDHSHFDMFWLGVIMLNAIFLGVQLQVYVTSGEYHISNAIGETVFTSMFVVEVSMRIARDGVRKYFCGPALGWALLDVFVITLSFFDIIVTYARITLPGFLSSFNILRMARALRVAKVIRGVRFMRNLRLLLAGMINSVMAIIWTLVALLFLMYMGSILVMSVVADKIIGGETYYVDAWGGLFTSMTTLFQVMSGDAWWSEVVVSLRDEFPALQVFFILYYCITAFGLLNIVTGIFVEQTLNTSKTDAEILKDQTDEAKEMVITFLTDVFNMMDRDQDGKVFFDEFEHFVCDPMVQFALEQVHLKVDDVLNLFLLLDKSGDENIDLEEFVYGCLKARGSPTTADVIEHGMRSRNLLLQVLQVLQDITARLDTGNIETKDAQATPAVHQADETVLSI